MAINARFFDRLGPIPLIELVDGIDIQNFPEGSYTDLMVENGMPIDQASSVDICYFEPVRGRKHPEKCEALVCLTTADISEAIIEMGAIALETNSPRAEFARILNKLYRAKPYGQISTQANAADNPNIAPSAIISQGAIIGEGAKIGKNTIIGFNSVIGPGVEIGDQCEIGNNVVIEFSTIGDQCKIYHGAVIGSTGFGVASSKTGGIDIPHIGAVQIGNQVTVGSCTTIDRAMFGQTKIGNGCKFDNQVQIAHNCDIGEHSMFAAHVGISGSCTIGSGVLMGGKAGMADHLSIGDGAMLAAGGSTMHNIPAGEKWSGVPAQPIRNHMREVSALRKLVAKKKK